MPEFEEPEEPDLIEMFLKAHKRGVKKAIDPAAYTKTSLIVCVNGKVKALKPTAKKRKKQSRTPHKKK